MHNPRINPKSLLITILATFVVISVTDFLQHGVWLKPAYEATASIWRPKAEMESMMWVMMLAHLLIAIPATLLYARIATTACRTCGIVFGLCYGLLFASGHLMSYFVHSIPGHFITKWVIVGLVQGVLLGLTAFYVYKPAKG